MIRRTPFILSAALIALAAPLAAESSAVPVAKGNSASRVNPDIWPRPQWPIARDAATEKRIAELLAKMTIEEKIGQLVQADISAVTPEEAKRYHLGSILNGGNSAPGGDEFAPAKEWLALADAFYEASVDKSGGRAGIPIIWGTDAVHGHSNIVGATLFPHNIGLGAMRDPDVIEKIGRATAIEIRTTGMEWTFAPTVTVPQDFRWGRAYEGYSSDPGLVSSYVGRMILGLQGKPDAGPMLAGPYVIASTKHYLADGGTKDGRDQGDAEISEQELRDIHGMPYVPAIEAGVGTVMASFSSWNGEKLTGSYDLLTRILRQRLNFDGFVVSDWNAHGQIPGCSNASCPDALIAGIDMYMAPDSWKAIYASLLAQAKAGQIPAARVDEAVASILRVKMRLGLFEAGKPSARPWSGRFDLLGHADHRAVAREAVGKSLVLLKNAGNILPLKPGGRILVAGDAADDIGRQSGGWTLTWQGTGVDNSHFPGATSIFRGIADAAQAAGGSATLSADGSYSAKPDAAIVVFGETPYAEFQGDLKTLQLRPALKDGPLATMRKLKAAGVPVVAVMITGRPLFMNQELNAADAFVVAWLPGSEGQGVADRLFAADAASAFTGKLPTAWPATARQDGPILFPFGHGLSAATKAGPWQPLSEDSGVSDIDSGNNWLQQGVVAPSWSLLVAGGDSAETRITTLPAKALGGRATVTATDHRVQEGGRRFALSGGPADIRLNSFEPVDLLRETNGDVLLTFALRVDTPPDSAVRLGMQGAGQGAQYVPFDLAGAKAGQWISYGIPLKCFAGKGVEMGRVAAPFIIATEAKVTFSLSDVALGTNADQRIPCP